MFDQLEKHEVLEAIRKGVHDAVWQMITNATDTQLTPRPRVIPKPIPSPLRHARWW